MEVSGQFHAPDRCIPGKSPCTHSVVCRMGAGKGPSPGFEFGTFDAVLPDWEAFGICKLQDISL